MLMRGVPVGRDTNCVWDTAGNRAGFVRGGCAKIESPPRTFYVGLLLLRRDARLAIRPLAARRRALSLLHPARDGACQAGLYALRLHHRALSRTRSGLARKSRRTFSTRLSGLRNYFRHR